ncbi:MAG: AraC family transcriptional regulator [Solobacterium sp.]|nr:AraC family transcriptional regulator [Solobacterium sp.]MCH4221826.1 AraC family transcriptional regulator [Solobacterium sp.]MCH4265048.1 AraC family transcriptional regulator [Solobacterium sp.]
MYNKTTSANYLKYGKVSDSFKKKSGFAVSTYTETVDTVYEMRAYNSNVYIEPMEGMALLRVAENPILDEVEDFALHRSVRINAGNYFALVPMTGSIVYRTYVPEKSKSKMIRLEHPIAYEHIISRFNIQEIIAYYYVVKAPSYFFPGEVHNFYELTYVDTGEVETTVQGKLFTIHAGQCMLYGPGEFHDQKVTSDKSCSYLTVVFQARGLDNSKLLDRVFTCTRTMISTVDAFVKSCDDTSSYHFDEMITDLRSLIIEMLQSEERTDDVHGKATTPINQYFENRLMEEIIAYINQHLYEPLPIQEITDQFSISRSTLQNLFKNNMDIAPKQYINEAKLNRSRVLIRKGDHTISEISNMLGFNSIHYFSRKFTIHYGITPTEFSKKIYDQKDE